MTRLAQVKSERDAAQKRAAMLELAVYDAEFKMGADVEFACADGWRYGVELFPRADPYVSIVQVSTDRSSRSVRIVSLDDWRLELAKMPDGETRIKLSTICERFFSNMLAGQYDNHYRTKHANNRK